MMAAVLLVPTACPCSKAISQCTLTRVVPERAGSADHDKAIGLLTVALAPAHSPAAAARRLEAALHELHDSKDSRVMALVQSTYCSPRDS